jgi:hypothetical protein
MSPPIRDGSGSSIGSIKLGDGSEISEVRTGAGDVLFSAISIPDSGNLQSRIDARSLSLSNQNTISSSDLNDLADSNNTVTVASGDPIYETNQVAGEPAITIEANERIDITFSASLSTPYSIFVLGQYNQLNTGTHIWAVDPIPGSGLVGHMPGNTKPDDFVYKINGSGNDRLQTENSNANIFNDIISTSSQDSRLNGGSEVANSANANSTLDGISLGGRVDNGGRPSNRDVSITEVLIYGVDENSNETDIESYMDRNTTLI